MKKYASMNRKNYFYQINIDDLFPFFHIHLMDYGRGENICQDE